MERGRGGDMAEINNEMQLTDQLVYSMPQINLDFDVGRMDAFIKSTINRQWRRH